MKLFSKIAFLFNLAFLFAVTVRMIERKDPQAESPLAGFQAVENTLVVMGYTAVLINLVFVIAFFLARMGGRSTGVFQWIWIFNCIFLVLQILYFFVLP